VQLLCAPRKPERFDAAFSQLGGAPQCVRRSQTISAPCSASHSPPRAAAPRSEPPSLFLLDTIGELRAAYSLATVAVIGRSFGALHGSDPIEPVSLGIPTVIGPRYSDFHSIVETLKAADAIEITTIPELPAVLRRLINDPARRAQLAANGLACIRSNQGATRRHADMLLALLAATTPGTRSPATAPVG
jgi:3-deoxy-D-manno-octulosonic-acid transferase